MEQVKNLLTRQRLSHLLTGSIIGILIGISPIIFYSYKCFPDVKVWETSLVTFDSVYFQSVNVFAWTFLSKFVVLYLLVIWFITCKHWWYHVLFIPLSMYLHQIVMLLNDEHFFKDEFQRWYTLPIIIGIGALLYFLRMKLKRHILILDLTQTINHEIEKLTKS